MAAPLTTAQFVEQIGARRADAGKPPRITDAAVYRILDGILAARRKVSHDEAA